MMNNTYLLHIGSYPLGHLCIFSSKKIPFIDDFKNAACDLMEKSSNESSIRPLLSKNTKNI